MAIFLVNNILIYLLRCLHLFYIFNMLYYILNIILSNQIFPQYVQTFLQLTILYRKHSLDPFKHLLHFNNTKRHKCLHI